MGRRKWMVRWVPVVFFFVVLKHGKVGDPEQFEIPRYVSGAVERSMPVSILAGKLQAGFSRGGELCMLVRGSPGFAFRSGDGNNRNNQVFRICRAQFADFCRCLGTLLFQLSKIVQDTGKVF